MTEAGRYAVLAEPARAEIEILSSRFIGDVAFVESSDAAQAFLQSIRDQHPDATHHCWAFLVGEPGSSRDVGFSDDGEPHNTAGRPMLQVLSHSGLGDLVAVVTRYYGGTKLGRGGLVRAYSSAVQEALQDAKTQQKIDWVFFTVVVDYSLAPALERLFPDFEVEVLEQTYAEKVTQSIRAPSTQVDDLRRALRDASRGEVELLEDDPAS